MGYLKMLFNKPSKIFDNILIFIQAILLTCLTILSCYKHNIFSFNNLFIIVLATIFTTCLGQEAHKQFAFCAGRLCVYEERITTAKYLLCTL